MEKIHNYIFILIVLLIILVGNFTLVRSEKDLSSEENRNLQKFEHLTLNSYIDGTYQNNLESALSDQFIGSGTIKKNFKALLNMFNYNNIPKEICSNKYVNLANGYYNFNCDDALILKNLEYSEDDIKKIEDKIIVYNELNKYIDTSYYFLSTANIYNFEKNEYSIDVIKILKEKLKGNYKISALEFKNYEEYINYFYKNDHHWNHKGSYQAYKDIISMLRPRDKHLIPIDEITFDDAIFYGSSARVSQIFDFKEKFTVYKFDLPNMEIINNRKDNTYGEETLYLNGQYKVDKYTNHYGSYYGGDPAEVIFDSDCGKYNLLVIGSSYTNALDKLLAAHFNKVYDIDLRHYKNTFNEDFNIKEYIEKNNINKVLVVADYNFLISDEFNIEWRG